MFNSCHKCETVEDDLMKKMMKSNPEVPSIYPCSRTFYSLCSIQIRLDANKFTTEVRRPLAQSAQGIGAWLGIMKTLTYLSIVSNVRKHTCSVFNHSLAKEVVGGPNSDEGTDNTVAL
jgi:hypothetical protein